MRPVKSINHVGIAVRSIDASRPFYETTLGAQFEGYESVESDHVRVAFLRVGEMRLELLEPTSSDSVIATHLEERGEGLHHIAFSVDNLAARIEELRTEGISMIDLVPRQGARDHTIAFVHPRSTSGVLLEICEPSSAGSELDESE